MSSIHIKTQAILSFGSKERVEDLLHIPKLTDGVIFLRPMSAEDAADHLAGEDDEMTKWVSGGRSTPATVEAFIRNNEESWRRGGPRRAFGVFDCASNRLAGFIEVNLARLVGPCQVEPGQVNVSYGVFREWRRQGVAYGPYEAAVWCIHGSLDGSVPLSVPWSRNYTIIPHPECLLKEWQKVEKYF